MSIIVSEERTMNVFDMLVAKSASLLISFRSSFPISTVITGSSAERVELYIGYWPAVNVYLDTLRVSLLNPDPDPDPDPDPESKSVSLLNSESLCTFCNVIPLTMRLSVSTVSSNVRMISPESKSMTKLSR